METKRYKVTFDGTIAEGLTKENVIKNLASRYKMDVRKVERIFFEDLPKILIKSVDYQTATELENTLRGEGAVCIKSSICQK